MVAWYKVETIQNLQTEAVNNLKTSPLKINIEEFYIIILSQVKSYRNSQVLGLYRNSLGLWNLLGSITFQYFSPFRNLSSIVTIPTIRQSVKTLFVYSNYKFLEDKPPASE